MPQAFLSAAAAWNRFWFEPESVSTLAVIRIAFALVVLGWTAGMGHDLFAFFSSDGLLSHQQDPSRVVGPGAWGPLGTFTSDTALSLTYVALFVAALMLLVGLKTRFAAVVVFIGLMALTRRNIWVLNSGDPLMRSLAFFLMLAPSGAALSLDRRFAVRRGRVEPGTFPLRAPWVIRLLQIQLSVLYLSAFWFKAGGETWRDGTAISYALRLENFQRLPLPDALITSELMSNLLTFGTLALELSLGLLVWNRRLRPWVLLAGVGLHLGIDYAIRVGFFSYAILVLYLAFIPPETMDRWLIAARAWFLRRRRRAARASSTSASAFAAPGRVANRWNVSSLRRLRPRGDGARKGTGVSGMGVRSQALRAIRRRGRRLVSDQSGQTLVEYALIIAMVGVSAIGALGYLGDKLGSLYSQTANTLNSVSVVTAGPAGCGLAGSDPAPDFTPPRPVCLRIENGGGAGNLDGRPDEGDQIVITFSERLEASSMCEDWGANDIPHALTDLVGLTIDDNGAGNGHDQLRIVSTGGQCNGNAPHMGLVDLGSAGFVAGSVDFSNSDITWDPSTCKLTFVLGAASGGTAGNFVSPVPAIYTPSAAMFDIPGNAITGSVGFTDVQF